jgi:3-dehydroquinate synthase
MQESFDVVASSGSYRVVIGLDLLSALLADKPDAIFIVDDALEARLPASATRRIVIHANETAKSLEHMADIVIKLRELGANRNTHVIAIGGGVVQDIATFATSIYMRGVSWTYMPSTLLSMTDSCIGGKSSINVLGYKNLIGNFYPPSDVYVDVNFAKTLTTEMIVGGLFEAGKICYAHGAESFASYLSHSPSAQISVEAIRDIIALALETKKWFIETDEFDQNERLLLNFGHTFGHAIEAGTDFAVSHGVAVGAGMIVAVEYARKQGWLSLTGQARTTALVEHVLAMLGIGHQPIAATPDHFDLDRILEKFNNDKKHGSNAYRMICPQGDGGLEIVSADKNEATRANIATAFTAAFKQLNWAVTTPQAA